MTKDKALRMTLNWLVSGNFVYPTALRTAIEEALAQPEVFSKQNYLNGYCVGQSDLLAEQAKQEPAAWMVYTQDGKSVYITDNPTDIESNQRALPLYVTPQREWVGLTDDERRECTQSPFADDNFRTIEAKLKEKNQ